MAKKNERLFACKQCNMFYKQKKMAQECEKWCKKNHSCNIMIIKHAVKC